MNFLITSSHTYWTGVKYMCVIATLLPLHVDKIKRILEMGIIDIHHTLNVKINQLIQINNPSKLFYVRFEPLLISNNEEDQQLIDLKGNEDEYEQIELDSNPDDD